MKSEQLIAALGIKHIPDTWQAFYEDVRKTYKKRASEILDTESIAEILDTYHVLQPYRENVLAAAREVAQNEALSLFVCLLERAMEEGQITEIDFPIGTSPGYRFYCLFPLLPTIPQSAESLRVRGIPEEIVQKTLTEYNDCVYVYSLHCGVPGFNSRYFGWMQLLRENRLIRLGRLNFELRGFAGNAVAFSDKSGNFRILADGVTVHKSGRLLGSLHCEDAEGSFSADIEETADAYIGYPVDETGLVEKTRVTLPKSEWVSRLRHDEPVLAVHIPRMGSLSPENCEASYALAREIFAKHYPEYKYKGFSCVSWLVDKQLGKILKPDANIVSFQNKYISFPIVGGGDPVFSFVFLSPLDVPSAPRDYTKLPEDTSLKRALKEHYIRGNCIYADGGIFF